MRSALITWIALCALSCSTLKLPLDLQTRVGVAPIGTEVLVPAGSWTREPTILPSRSSANPLAAQDVCVPGLPSVPFDHAYGYAYDRRGNRMIQYAEQNIAKALPKGSVVKRWGISWATSQKAIPCPDSCAPMLDSIGGIIEGD
jgi:hypothetical protein